MIYKKKIKYIFLLSHDNQKPFNNFSLFKDDYVLAILPYYRFTKSHYILEKSQIFINRKKINENYKKIHYLFEPIGILLFHLNQFLFLVNFLKNNKKDFDNKIILISTGIKNYLYSSVIKLLKSETILVNYPMDPIYEDANYFGNNYFQKFLNKAVIKIQNLLRRNCLRSAHMIYESSKLYNYEKIKYKFFKYKPIIFNYMHCNYKYFLDNKKKKEINNNVMYFGNLFLNDNHFQTLLNVQCIIKKKYNIQLNLHVVGGDPHIIAQLKEKNKHVRFYGYISDFNKIKRIFHKCCFGTALYNFNTKTSQRLVSSGKIQNYIQHALIVLGSENVMEKNIINQYKLGIATNDIDLLVRFIIRIIKSRVVYSRYLMNLNKYTKKNNDNFYLQKFYNEIKMLSL
jgi:hypothetical protein